LLRNIEMKTSLKFLCAAALIVAVALPVSAATVSVLPAFFGATTEPAGARPQARSNHHRAKAVRLNKATRFAKSTQSNRGGADGSFQFAGQSGGAGGSLQNGLVLGGSVASFLTSTGAGHSGRDLMAIADKSIKRKSGKDDGGVDDPILVVDGDGTNTGIDTQTPSPVPLPGAAGLMLIGLMALGAAAKARRT
jgi:hypothetical protein